MTTELYTTTKPIRFAGRPVCDLYGVQLVVTVRDIHGMNDILRIFCYVFSSTTVSFFLRLTDKRRLGFDKSLREHHSRYLQMFAWYKLFATMVASHLLLRFFSMHKCLADSLY